MLRTVTKVYSEHEKRGRATFKYSVGVAHAIADSGLVYRKYNNYNNNNNYESVHKFICKELIGM